ncbi:MAG: DUF6602 domain-containing protein [Acidobacteriota bacterium]
MTKMSKRVAEVIKADLTTAIAEFNRDRDIPHAGTKGSSREDIVIRILGNYIPKKYGLIAGHAITADDDWSRQQDIIIYDQFNAPLIGRAGSAGIIVLIESVVATIEVKSALDTRELQDIGKKGADIQRLASKRRTGSQHPVPNILSAAFAFESSLPISKINEYVRAYRPPVDILCLLSDVDHNSAFFLTHQPTGIMVLPADTGETNTIAFSRFVYEILSHLEMCGRSQTSPALDQYMGVFGLSELSQIQTVMNKLLHAGQVSDEELICMLHRMSQIQETTTQEVFKNEKAVFGFDRGSTVDGYENIEVWKVPSSGETITARKVFEVVNRSVLGETLTPKDADLLKAVLSSLRRVKEAKEKLVIKVIPELTQL